MKFSIEELRDWFEEEKRDLPWRVCRSPYGVWISEVMLQQTTVNVVIPYFKRWMERFPSVEALAKATLEDVIKLWEGLGYYSRARNLHMGAKYLMENYGGALPASREELEKVKGLGPYTVGAILSFGFHQKATAVDGNVLRVISRLYAIEDEIDRLKTQKKIGELVYDLLPDTKPWVIMEALIELGAKTCRPKPNCVSCPLQDDCLALKRGIETELPKKRKRAKVKELKRYVFVICHENAALVQRIDGKKVMSGLYEFPYSEKEKESFLDGASMIKHYRTVKHTFTRFRAHLFPSLWKSPARFELPGFEWTPLDQLENHPFSSGHRKILQELLEDHAHTTH